MGGVILADAAFQVINRAGKWLRWKYYLSPRFQDFEDHLIMPPRTELRENAFRQEINGDLRRRPPCRCLDCRCRLRKLGLKTVIFEAGSDIGGTWRWKCYPGAGVDSEVPEYMLSIPETWKDWTWLTNYPSYGELHQYFDHVDNVLQIKKDTAFSSVVFYAKFDTSRGRWHIRTADGRSAQARYFIVATGFSAKRYIPEWPGMDRFKGIVHHSSFWPDEHIDVGGKRCAVIGTGASGVQVTQAWGPQAASLRVFQRTPNLALPIRNVTLPNQKKPIPNYFHSAKSFGGFLYTFHERDTFDDNEEERQTFFVRLWEEGGFRFWLANYKDYLFNAKANRRVYEFLTRERIGDPKQRDILAPLELPHYFGVKSPALQSTSYEQFNRPNVEAIDIKPNGISRFTENGIQLQDGTVYELDIICIATGFDIATGGMTNVGLKSIYGTELEKEWKSGPIHTSAPRCVGIPTCSICTDHMGRWIAHAIKQMERKDIKYINPTHEAVEKWKKRINRLSEITLFPTVKSTYLGGNVPGKAFEQVNYAGGEPAYVNEIRAVLPSFDGFEVVKGTREASQLSKI
ncbi:Steroid monooxygenase (CpmA) [Penicillium argentinense]|uniref:Steroid monooxygenase (CpmA) n=1 Tax=Penicillium argentinense TaxID=1131581 RepID=A0A9W9EXY4_9EURO|nr:Steroid monooxygenase (CpmA) [Penicillium argentinense]KAJ5089921.1 Steroid monooxygenase (CpmA) [Penicillium argentinense]